MEEPPMVIVKGKILCEEGRDVLERSAIFENIDTGGSTGGSADVAHFVKDHLVAITESFICTKTFKHTVPLPSICSRT